MLIWDYTFETFNKDNHVIAGIAAFRAIYLISQLQGKKILF